ncbi:thiamine phosphate synthase [Thiolapillus sp.]
MKRLTGLYAITMDGIQGKALLAQARAALEGGCRILQYRDKSGDAQRRREEALALLALCHEYRAVLIINDDLALCRQCNAHGVHLGRDDMPVAAARKILGRDKIIGISCYDDLQRGHRAASQGADYLAFGAIYPSVTKPAAANASLALLQRAKSKLDPPIVAIGGITPENADQVIQAGADMVAMIQGLFGQEDIRHAAQKTTRLFK